MMSHENVIQTSEEEITPALSLDMSLKQAINQCFARDLFDAFTKEWEVFYDEEYYEGILP